MVQVDSSLVNIEAGISADGHACMRVTFAEGNLMQAGCKIPLALTPPGSLSGIEALGELDTGASGTVINRRILDRLSLPIEGTVKSVAVNSDCEEELEARRVAVHFPNGKNITVTAGVATFADIDILIGRDLLQFMRFEFDGPKNSFVVVFSF